MSRIQCTTFSPSH